MQKYGLLPIFFKTKIWVSHWPQIMSNVHIIFSENKILLLIKNIVQNGFYGINSNDGGTIYFYGEFFFFFAPM